MMITIMIMIMMMVIGHDYNYDGDDDDNDMVGDSVQQNTDGGNNGSHIIACNQYHMALNTANWDYSQELINQ